MRTPAVCLFIALGVLAAPARGGDPCCTRCKCAEPTNKVCRIVCETHLVPKVEYARVCQDFCIRGPSQPCGEVCTSDCATPCQQHCRCIWKPGCAEVGTRWKLLKRIVYIETPAYRWVVEDVCCRCEQGSATVADPAAAPAAGPLEPEPASAQQQPDPSQPSPLLGAPAVQWSEPPGVDRAAQLHRDFQRW